MLQGHCCRLVAPLEAADTNSLIFGRRSGLLEVRMAHQAVRKRNTVLGRARRAGSLAYINLKQA